MPFVLIIIGIVLVVSSVRDTVTNGNPNLVSLLKGDFTGSNNFSYWMLSILVIGGVGYIPSMKKLSAAFMTLVILVLFLHNKGFFAQFQQQAFGTSSANAPIIGGITL